MAYYYPALTSTDTPPSADWIRSQKNIKSKANYYSNRDSILAKHKLYRDTNREKLNLYRRSLKTKFPNRYKKRIKVCHKSAKKYYLKFSVARKQWLAKFNSSPNYYYSKYKTSAKQGKKEFSISFYEFSLYWEKPCLYCGAKTKGVQLDRINNNYGYIPGNVASCCFACNRGKFNYSQKEFIERCRAVANNFPIGVVGEIL